MIVGLRRAATAVVAGLVVSLGAAPLSPAHAETPTPTPVATAAATPAANDSDGPDVTPDASRQTWALGGAAAVALLAAGVVFLRRR